MSDQDIFNDENGKPVEPQTSASQVKIDNSNDTFSQMLQMIVNQEGKPKYNTVEDALKGAAHAQQHIATLEKELSELKNKVGNSKTVEDLIATLQAKKETPDPQTKQDQPDIQKIVKDVINDIQTTTTKEQNVKTVTSKFKELYGEKASETLYGKAEDLGMSKAEINSLIASNPKAAMKLLGVEEKTSDKNAQINSKFNQESFNQKPQDKPKSIMGYVSSKDLTSAWLASKARTNERLGIKG